MRTESNDHMDTWQAETYELGEEQDWLEWVHHAFLLFREVGFCIAEQEWTTENTLPIGLDGDQDAHGFSLDVAYTKWASGCSPASYLEEARRNRFQRRR